MTQNGPKYCVRLIMVLCGPMYYVRLKMVLSIVVRLKMVLIPISTKNHKVTFITLARWILRVKNVNMLTFMQSLWWTGQAKHEDVSVIDNHRSLISLKFFHNWWKNEIIRPIGNAPKYPPKIHKKSPTLTKLASLLISMGVTNSAESLWFRVFESKLQLASFSDPLMTSIVESSKQAKRPNWSFGKDLFLDMVKLFSLFQSIFK